MNSRIFQLSEEPINIENYITEEDLYESFIGLIADSVCTSDREDDIEWLDSELKTYGVIVDHEIKSIYFPKGFKISYFKKSFKELKQRVKDLTLKDFIGESVEINDMNLYRIKRLIDNKYGFYIFKDCPQSLDYFIRDNSVDNMTYYIGNTLDYHF